MVQFIHCTKIIQWPKGLTINMIKGTCLYGMENSILVQMKQSPQHIHLAMATKPPQLIKSRNPISFKYQIASLNKLHLTISNNITYSCQLSRAYLFGITCSRLIRERIENNINTSYRTACSIKTNGQSSQDSSVGSRFFERDWGFESHWGLKFVIIRSKLEQLYNASL